MRLTKLIAVAVSALCTPSVNLAKYVNKRMKHLGQRGIQQSNNTPTVLEKGKGCIPAISCKQLYSYKTMKQNLHVHISALYGVYVGKVKILASLNICADFHLSFSSPHKLSQLSPPLLWVIHTDNIFLSASGVFMLSISCSSHATDMFLFLSSHQLGPIFSFPCVLSEAQPPWGVIQITLPTFYELVN